MDMEDRGRNVFDFFSSLKSIYPCRRMRGSAKKTNKRSECVCCASAVMMIMYAR